ncbi:hypothetical protein [Planctobacterium marinum]|uniref:DUF2059 domain-containing protein n=1 Tax=Planctobacterium marinum TaxID=1631968 RepID=A0AA48HRS6_9ALTE|nr:hypothetical protein MACH26_01690 [Planctobacterium marinum]
MHIAKLTLSLLLLFTCLAKAQGEKSDLVDAVLHQSSIEISILSMPSQLAQLPALMPLKGQHQQQLMEDLVDAIMTDFNEVEVLSSIKAHFMVKGDSQKLRQTLLWLQSGYGKEITQIEILAQQQDPVLLQQYVMNFSEQQISAENLAIFKKMVRVSQLNETMFKMMESFLPAMMKGMADIAEVSGHALPKNSGDFEQQIANQVNMMRNQFGPMLEMQMVATLSYLFRDASAPTLLAYNDFLSSAAGQHYLQLSMESMLQFGLDWVESIMANLAQVMDSQALVVRH